jgi:hypothetical protein
VPDFPNAYALALPANESRFPALDPANDRGLRVLMQIERVSFGGSAPGVSSLVVGFRSRHAEKIGEKKDLFLLLTRGLFRLESLPPVE